MRTNLGTISTSWFFCFCVLFCSTVALANRSDKTPYPFHIVQKTADGAKNDVQVLSSGVASLQKRLDMINSATDHIEVEYFIYGLDTSSRLFTQALVRAASERNVKVRILIDKSAAIFEFNEFYAQALAKHNIEVRYYNAAPIIQVSTVNFRNHRKLLSVDDKEAITGGRNIEDDYFDLSEIFNFNDHDIYVRGDMVKGMRESFDIFFNAKIVEKPIFPQRPNDQIEVGNRDFSNPLAPMMVDNSPAVKKYFSKISKAEKLITESDSDRWMLERVKAISTPILEDTKIYSCPELTFTTDRPYGSFATRFFNNYSEDYRYLRKTIHDKVETIDKQLIISSPYMINNFRSLPLMWKLQHNNVPIKLYTNSLASTDAIYVAANLYRSIYVWIATGIEVYLHDGIYIPETETVTEGVKKAKWGTHSKVQIFERNDIDGVNQDEFMVGTYNVDNRSNYYNTEMAIFCKGNKEFTQEVMAGIMNRAQNGYRVGPKMKAIDKNGRSVSILGASKKDLLKMTAIALPSWLLQLLL